MDNDTISFEDAMLSNTIAPSERLKLLKYILENSYFDIFCDKQIIITRGTRKFINIVNPFCKNDKYILGVQQNYKESTLDGFIQTIETDYKQIRLA